MSAEKKADKPGHHKTLSGSKPIHIGGSGAKPDPKAGYRTKDGMILAASAPVISMQPPPPPSARPRIPSVEPPPMELPPSPPVFSPMQAEAAAQQAQAQKVQFAAGTGGTAKPKPPVVYSRSLSNYSSSAPAGHLDFLTNFQPKFGAEDAVKEEDEDEEDDTVSNTIPTGAGNTAGIPTAAQQKRLSAVKNEALSLSKSPTVFSILTQGLLEHPGPNAPPASTSTSSASSSHVRGIVEVPSTAASTAAGSAKEKKDEIGSAEGGDDLQFSISLDDNGGGEEEEQSEQQESGYF